jgi:CubicO group peptidase (beta-lactamase class C family)
MGAAPEVRRAFVEQNFTRRVIDKRGIDELVRMLGVLHQDFAANPPLRVEAFPDRFEALFKFADRDERVLFTVRLSAPPESLIDGFMTGPAAQEKPEAAVTAGELPKAIAAYLQSRAEEFSGAVIVAKDGKPIFAQAYGMADREKQRVNTLDTPFNLGSNNKMFTALLIARLVEQGKLDWNDKLGKYLPDWPQQDVREKVSIEHLLTHTSGLGEFWGAEHDAQRTSLDGVVKYAALFKSDAPSAEPGKDFKYSNNGFVLLGLIAERVARGDYYELVRQYVYRPAGMTNSDHYRPDDERSMRAIGYQKDGSPNTTSLAARGSPAGGGYASANDLLHFANALQAGKIVRTDTLDRMTTKHSQMGGPNAGYGYGFGVFQDRERRYGHNGGAPGINASFEIFPDSHYVVIVLANTDRGASEIAQRLARMIMGRTP